jgi:hypothetical protein
MNQQKKNLSVAVTLAVIAGAVFGALGYYVIARSFPASPTNVFSTSTISSISPISSTSSVTADISSSSSSNQSPVSTSSSIPVPVDMSSWQTYTNYELGFSIQYPPDLTLDTSNPYSIVLSFPATYFSTTMKDSDSISVEVSATCTPVQSYSDKTGEGTIPAQSAIINGIVFTKNSQYSLGAGSHDDVDIYDAYNNSACYRITSASHGVNSASVYVTDSSQIAAMDVAHSSDAANVAAIAQAVISTFNFATTPAGENEADYAAQSTQQSISTSTINMRAISPNAISVGGQLALTGSAFSGHDTIIWISNGSVQGVLWGGMPTSDTLITTSVPTQVCTQYVGASGAPCPSYLVLSPGIYTVTVSNQNGTTNPPLYIRIQ